jgi:RNA polymerase sigma-70 factor (ECF subfamily)
VGPPGGVGERPASSQRSGARFSEPPRGSRANLPSIRPSSLSDPAAASEEAALLRRVAAGDHREALGVLHDRHATRIYRLGLRLLGDRGRAEELVQETFVRLWQSAARFDPERSTVGGFVLLLARRAAVDVLRRSAVRPVHVALDGASGDEPVSDDQVAQLVEGLAVREALEALSPDHRRVLELGYDEDLTQTQIAARLELPLGTVKSRTYHALRALREELGRRGIDA